jgi:Glycosyltransferase family 87
VEGLARHPHWVLALGAVLVFLLDAGRIWCGTDWYWLWGEAAVAAAALILAWLGQERLRLVPLLAIACAFQAALVLYHVSKDVAPDFDVHLFASQGRQLLDGDYPRSEYPTGAVSLFALETWLGDDSARTANALLMIPFQLIAVCAVWSLRTRWSAWLAAVVALWPLNAYSWEFKFDLVPAALLAAGLALAYRERYGLAGAVLGLGAAVKWTPALALAALLLWLLASRMPRDALRSALAAVAVFALVTLPYLAWQAGDVVAAYTIQGRRTITGESLPYLPLRALGQAELGEDFTHAADVPGWANSAATVVQLLLVAVVLALTVLVRGRRAAGVAVAALVPVVFLLTNRIFSTQFLVLLLVAWAVAIALLARSRSEQLLLGVLAGAASACNAFVYPYVLPGPDSMWQVSSVLFFLFAIVLTVWLLVLARRARSADYPGRP